MAKELNEDTGFQVSIKTLVGIGAVMATIISMWFMLQSDIAAPIPISVFILTVNPVSSFSSFAILKYCVI